MRVEAAGRALDLRLPSPLAELRDDRLARAGVRLYLKRDDLINPDIPGNKWRKLRYNLESAKRQGQRTLVTFGGAYSNHVRATAAAGHYFGFATVGVIRGEEHLPLNPSLGYAVRHGMRLAYLDRTAYRAKMDRAVLGALRREYGEFYLLPEGGSNADALRGCAEIPAEVAEQLDRPFDLICCPCGTGGTLAGLAHGLRPGQRTLGFSVLNGGQFLAGQVAALQREAFGHGDGNHGDGNHGYGNHCRSNHCRSNHGCGNSSINHDFHFGGYAKRRPALDRFIAEFHDRHGLTLDWIYTAKMMYGIFARAADGTLRPGTTVVAVLTGGPPPPAPPDDPLGSGTG